MRIRTVMIPLFYVVLALAMTWPLVADLGGSLGSGLDPQLQSWILAWDIHALRTNPLAIWQAPIFFPYPNTLAYTDHHLLLAVLAAPLIWATGSAAVGHNVLVILSYALSGYSVSLLAREMWGAPREPVLQVANNQSCYQWFTADLPFLAAGAAFAFCAFRMAQFVHLQMLQTAWLPLALLYLIRVLRSARWRDGLLCGLFFAIQCVTALYFAYFVALTLGLYAGLWVLSALWMRFRRDTPLPWTVLPRLLVGVIVAGVIVIPLMLPYLRVYQSIGVVRSPRELENWSAPLQSYLAVDSGNWLLGRFRPLQASGGEFALFPGLVVSLLALVGVHGRRGGDRETRERSIESIHIPFLLLLAALAFTLSLGTVLRLTRGGDVLPLPLPYAMLYERLPGFGALRVPARWGMLVSLAACLLAARGLLALRSAHGLVWIAVFAMILVESSTALPLTRVPDLAMAPPIYQWLGDAGQADIRAVLELPAGRTQRGDELEKTMRRQYYGALHWKPLVTGYSGLIPFGTTDILGQAQQLPNAGAIQFLQLVGIDTLVLHRAEYDPRLLETLLAGLDSSPVVRKRAEVGDVLVYTLLPFAVGDLPRGATVLLTSDERAPGVTALALAQRWTRNGARLYGAARIRYYGPLAQPQPGQVFDYGLLAEPEDPQRYGFTRDRQLWHAEGLALYARDPQLLVSLEPGVVPTGRFHPAYPAALDITVGALEAQIGGRRVGWAQAITSAVVELDIASLAAQNLETPAGLLAIPLGASRVSFPAQIGQLLRVAGLADATAIVRVRVRAGEPQPMMPPEPWLALAADARIIGSRLSVDARAAGFGSLLIEVRGAAAADDHPIALLSGIQPIAPAGHAAWSFSTDLLKPDEPWLQKKSIAVDGRYIVYVRDASHAAAPGTPIAQYRVRGGAVVDAQPVPLPLMALP